jgi:putative glycosyltransferase (TIGR04372 family)
MTKYQNLRKFILKVFKALVALTRDFLIMAFNLFITLISIRRLHHFVLFRDLITKLSHFLRILQIESFYDSPLLFERKILTKLFTRNPYAHQYGLAIRAEEKYLAEGHLNASPTFIEHSICTINARAEKFHSRLLILGPEWISTFGHISNLSLFPKAELLGWLQFSEKIICGGKSANSSMSNLYSEWYTFLKTDAKTQSLLDLCFRDSYQSMNAIPLDGNKVLDTYSAQFKIEEEITRIFGNSFHLLKVSEDLKLSGKQFLENAGLDGNSWFVTLHMREMHSSNQYRNGDNVNPDTYIEAVKKVLELGGQVIRIGNSGMTPLSLLGLKHERVLDYAHIERNDPRLDVFFLSQCKYMIGTGSGPITFPNEFGRPVLYTNTPAIGRTLRLRGVSTPQLLRDRETGKLLNIDEMLNNPLGWNVQDTTRKYERVKNTSLDIANAVIDLDKIVNENPDNYWSYPNLPTSKQSDLAEWKIGVPISNSFLLKYGGELIA